MEQYQEKTVKPLNFHAHTYSTKTVLFTGLVRVQRVQNVELPWVSESNWKSSSIFNVFMYVMSGVNTLLSFYTVPSLFE